MLLWGYFIKPFESLALKHSASELTKFTKKKASKWLLHQTFNYKVSNMTTLSLEFSISIKIETNSLKKKKKNQQRTN